MAERGGKIFRGLRFKLDGFSTRKDDEYREAIGQKGGLIEKKYLWQELYYIVSSEQIRYGDPECAEARSKGAFVLNELWLDEALNSGELPDTKNVLYRPPMALGGIKGAQDLNICHTGFLARESRHIENLVEMIGGQNVDIDNCSYLICNRLEDYEAAKGHEAFRVNKSWLEDSATNWEILSVDGYISWSRRARNYRTPKKENNDMNSKRESSSTGKKVKAQRSPEQSSAPKRQVLSTGRKKTFSQVGQRAEASCRRSLFTWKMLSDYKDSEMVVRVQIPRSNLATTIGTHEFKSALLGSYTAMANFHSGGHCILNSMSASRFRVSTTSEQVVIEQAQLLEYDSQLALANRKKFVVMVTDLFKEKQCSVPADISEWLDCITDSDWVSDKVLKRHINMQHPVDIFGSFIAMYGIVLRLKSEDFTGYTMIVNSKLTRKYMRWTKNFKWKVLNETLNYVHPRMAELKRLRSQGLENIVQAKDRAVTVFGILEVFRDRFIHPAMTYQDLLLPVLLTEYPGLLSDLQRRLFELGHLPNLR